MVNFLPAVNQMQNYQSCYPWGKYNNPNPDRKFEMLICRQSFQKSYSHDFSEIWEAIVPLSSLSGFVYDSHYLLNSGEWGRLQAHYHWSVGTTAISARTPTYLNVTTVGKSHASLMPWFSIFLSIRPIFGIKKGQWPSSIFLPISVIFFFSINIEIKSNGLCAVAYRLSTSALMFKKIAF